VSAAPVRLRVPLLPVVVDADAAALIHMAVRRTRGSRLVLDARRVDRITPNGADLLAATLADRTDRFPPVLINLPMPVRAALRGHPLLAFSSAPGPIGSDPTRLAAPSAPGDRMRGATSRRKPDSHHG
jgi:hypothetical protein